MNNIELTEKIMRNETILAKGFQFGIGGVVYINHPASDDPEYTENKIIACKILSKSRGKINTEYYYNGCFLMVGVWADELKTKKDYEAQFIKN
jgi:hypothetical protein